MRRALATGALVAAVACGGDREGARDTAIATAGTPPATAGAPAPAAGGGTGCDMFGAWRPCSVRRRLEEAGLAPQETGDTIRAPGFAVPGARWTIGEATLVVFLYPSPSARERDTRALDTLTAAPRGATSSPWPKLHPPTLMASGNLAAVLHGPRVSQRQRERVVLALTAGLPSR